MATILYVKASPRGQRSRSVKVADALIAASRRSHPDDTVDELNLFDVELPTFDGPALEAKYAILHGQSPSPEQAEAWQGVQAVIERFTSADKYVFAVPMWNFGVPYRLKHYLDVIVQPTYVFNVSDQGYVGLVTGKPAVVVSARGGDYSDPQAAAVDHEKPYVELILGFMGFTDIRHIVAEPTLAAGPEAAEAAVAAALEAAETVGREL